VIPLPIILSELIMGLGAALIVGNAWALIRSKPGSDPEQPVRVQARGKVVTSLFIGLLVFVWGLASFIDKLGA
jgi:hypothetical protein